MILKHICSNCKVIMEYSVREVVENFVLTKDGVKFNVETLKPSHSPDCFNFQKFSKIAKSICNDFYTEDFRDSGYKYKGIIENSNIDPHKKIVSGTFLHAALKAFDTHSPLIISPDDIWTLLTTAFSKHVSENFETLRTNFVKFEGTKELRITVGPEIMPGRVSSEYWEKNIFPEFANKIKEMADPDTLELINKGFSTSTISDIATYNIILMDSMKSYFSYGMRTTCGIPWIELRGKLEDWVNIKERAIKLWSIFPRDYQKNLLEVLNKFVASYKGKVDHLFWQSMVKRIKHGKGSGSYDTISGWINLLYPYNKHNKLNVTKSWRFMVQHEGVQPHDFPDHICSVPVKWEVDSKIVSLHFHAGIFGYERETNTNALSCVRGWIVTRDYPLEIEDKIEFLIEKLLRLQIRPSSSNVKRKICIIEDELTKLQKIENESEDSDI